MREDILMKFFKVTEGFKFYHPIHLLAFGLGTGFLRPGPGTWGTLPAIPLVFLLDHYFADYYLVVTAALLVSGVLICEVVTHELEISDHPSIVFDEWVGYMVAMLFIPVTIPGLVLGFILFRVFDIFKIGPVKFVDKNFKGSIGIMLDDVLAGLLAGAAGVLSLYLYNLLN